MCDELDSFTLRTNVAASSYSSEVAPGAVGFLGAEEAAAVAFGQGVCRCDGQEARAFAEEGFVEPDFRTRESRKGALMPDCQKAGPGES